MLQCVTVRCSVLQCVAVCCSALQCVVAYLGVRSHNDTDGHVEHNKRHDQREGVEKNVAFHRIVVEFISWQLFKHHLCSRMCYFGAVDVVECVTLMLVEFITRQLFEYQLCRRMCYFGVLPLGYKHQFRRTYRNLYRIRQSKVPSIPPYRRMCYFGLFSLFSKIAMSHARTHIHTHTYTHTHTPTHTHKHAR